MIPDHDAALAYLYSRIDYERTAVMPYSRRDFKLDRMRDLLARLGQPQARYPIVHITGTKGKGSTAAMVAGMLTAAGYRTGLFTSPHLERVEERMRIDGVPCAEDDLVALSRQLEPIVAAMDAQSADCGYCPTGPTFFELTTAMAMAYFATEQVQAAVLEVGLGGRLDSTNVCQPAVSVITSVSYDHMRQLGHTLAEIAAEKAGIVKPGIPVVSGVLADEPRQVIVDVCRRQQCRLWELGADFNFSYLPPRDLQLAPSPGRVDFQWPQSSTSSGSCWSTALESVELNLPGRHQAANAAVAWATIHELRRQGWSIPDRAIRDGLAQLVWPGRVEVVSRRPTVVLDAAHNVASIEALLTALDESFQAPRRILVFGTTREKEVGPMLQRLLPRFDEAILTCYHLNPRAVPVDELQQIASELTGRTYAGYPTPEAAWHAVRQMARPDDLICVTGSFFLAAEMRDPITRWPVAPSAALETV